MKKVFGTTLLICSLIFFGCNKKAEVEEPVIEEETPAVEETVIVADVECTLFYDSAYIWQLNDNGTLDGITQLYAGQVLKAFKPSDTSLSEEVEAQDFSRTGKTETETYTKVVYEDEVYWINSLVIAPNTTPAIVINPQTVVYNTASVVDASKNVVPQYQLVAVSKEAEKFEDSGIEFKKVTFRSADKSLRNVFVKKAVLSDKKDDVLAYRMLNRVAQLSNMVVKKELMSTCKTLACTTEMSLLIDENYAIYIENENEPFNDEE